MALLDLLYDYGYTIVVAHVNYHVREDSNEDSKLVSRYCRNRGIPFYRRDINTYKNENFEMQARNMRYKFYLDIALKHDTDKVVLGHHQDDVLETIIMQLNRGNTDGYLGIKDISMVQGLEVIRPLLGCSKEDLQQYCNNNDIPYRDDYTNFSTDYTRNYIRNITLKRYSIKEKKFLLRKAKEHNDIIDKKNNLFKKYFNEYDSLGKLNYHTINPYGLESVIYYMLKKSIYPPLISKGLIEEILRELKTDKPNIMIDLPVNYVFIKEYDNIYVSKKKIIKDYSYTYKELTMDENDYYKILPSGGLNEGVYISEEDYPITIRSPLYGDVIKTSSGHKKVSRLFINNKIPSIQRKSWPIVVNKDNEIILVPNLAKNVDYLTTKPNMFVIKL